MSNLVTLDDLEPLGRPTLGALLGRLKAHRVRSWDDSYGVTEAPTGGEEEMPDLSKADIVSSEYREGGRHALLLDIDYPAFLVESTNGNHHLYLDVPDGLSPEALMEILDVLGKHNVIEPGYAGASKRRGYTSLRPPGAKKGRPILRCVKCEKRPDEIDEYVMYAKGEDFATPDEFVWDNEGTLCKPTGQFACTQCYIDLGQPIGTADRYAIPKPLEPF